MSDSQAAVRLRLALDMYEFGVQIERSRLRRQNPDATDTEIEVAVSSWLRTPAGTPLGDAPGRPSHRFE